MGDAEVAGARGDCGEESAGNGVGVDRCVKDAMSAHDTAANSEMAVMITGRQMLIRIGTIILLYHWRITMNGRNLTSIDRMARIEIATGFNCFVALCAASRARMRVSAALQRFRARDA